MAGFLMRSFSNGTIRQNKRAINDVLAIGEKLIQKAQADYPSNDEIVYKIIMQFEKIVNDLEPIRIGPLNNLSGCL